MDASEISEHDQYRVKRRSLRWLIAFGVWNVIAVSYAIQVYFILDHANRKMTWDMVLTGPIAFWYAWAAFSPVIVWLSRRLPIDRKHLLRNIGTHALASVFFAFLHQAVYFLLYYFFQLRPGEQFDFVARLTGSVFTIIFSMNVVTYWMIVFGSHALQFYRNYRQGEVRASKLEMQLARAQLDALRMQLQPHFLFNTLNSISALLRENIDAADDMLEALGNFLRMTLEDRSAREVTLRREMEFVEAYLGIERIRFQELLTTRITVEPESLDARVPGLILQPLVENAIRHGIGADTSAGFIEIVAKRADGILLLRVTDNGQGVGDRELREGLGMKNTRARLEQMYGARYQFELKSDPGNGTTAEIQIPFRNDPIPGQEAG